LRNGKVAMFAGVCSGVYRRWPDQKKTPPRAREGWGGGVFRVEVWFGIKCDTNYGQARRVQLWRKAIGLRGQGGVGEMEGA